jgi:hexosaminidase
VAAQAATLFLGLALPWTARSGVIPAPAEVIPGVGSFNVGPGTVIQVPRGDRDALAASRYLVELWTRTNALTLPIAPGVANSGTANTDSIVFRRRRGSAAEGYELEVAPKRITVSASSAAGLFYGAVTLWQLLPPGLGTGRIAAQSIHDAPVYAWRGLMLDSARHMQSPAFIRSMIDWMAWHKLNVLHWHLTDDQGWRLEIRKYPRLTSVGAWRVEPNGERYGGFYSQEEVRDIVRFAATRHVQIVPEIDMPGHATAAIAAYPALGSGTGTPLVSPNWGVLNHLFNLEPETFRFLDDVLAEVVELFPSPIIHIGGDEAVKDEWQASPQIRARENALGIHDPEALQAYFTQRIGTYLATRGRRIVGWDEILQPGLRKDAVVMSWHGVSGASLAAAAGHDSVLAPDPGLYLDHRQSTLPSEPPGRLKVLSLEDVYRFAPQDPAQSDAERTHVLGLQANLWSEHMQTEERVQWMALPRAAALAEVGWSPAARRHWPDFLERLVPQFARYRAFGLNYADSVFAPAAQISSTSDGISLTLSNQLTASTPASVDAAPFGDIRYTLDGTQPSAQSPRYSAPLTLPQGTLIRAAAFVGSEQASHLWEKRLDARAVLRRDSHDLEQCSGGIGLLLLPGGNQSRPLAVDIMNPCWIDRGVDLSKGPRIVAAVAPLPFNYEIGADAAKIRVGDARTPQGEFEIHVDGCDTPALAFLPLASAADAAGVTTLPPQRLPALVGRHDLCLRFARPRLNPMWALDWVEIGG